MPTYLRRSIAAAAASIALVVTLPHAASAATGEFQYTYAGESGDRITGSLENPDSGVCITLPEVADPGSTEPAFAPRNMTDSTVTMFTDPDCEGDYYSLRPGGKATDRLKLRSVVFS